MKSHPLSLLMAVVTLIAAEGATIFQEFDRIGSGGIHVEGEAGGLFWDPGGLGGDYNDFGATWIQSSHGQPAGTTFQPETASFAVYPDNASSTGLLAAVTTAEWHVWEGSDSFVTNANTPDFVARDVDVTITRLGLSLVGTESFRVDANLSGIGFEFEVGQAYLMGLEIDGVSSRILLSDAPFDGNDDWAVTGDGFGFQQGPGTVQALTGTRSQFGSVLTVSIPEPSCLALVYLGVIVLGLRSRSNQKR